MTAAEVDAAVNGFAFAAPLGLLTAIQHITVYVAADRQDLAVIRAAISESGVDPGAIPQHFRAVFLGEQLDQVAAAADDVDDVVNSIRGVILLNAAMLRSAQDVWDTLLHEIGHALGFDEDEVAMLGLE